MGRSFFYLVFVVGFTITAFVLGTVFAFMAMTAHTVNPREAESETPPGH
jgi:hypothetical protein